MLKVVHVIWEDPSFATSGWLTLSEFEDFIKSDVTPADSVGILAYECDSFIVLLQSVGKDQVADGVKIARSAIRSIKELGSVPLSLEIEVAS
jgi:hypothetical protein